MSLSGFFGDLGKILKTLDKTRLIDKLDYQNSFFYKFVNQEAV